MFVHVENTCISSAYTEQKSYNNEEEEASRIENSFDFRSNELRKKCWQETKKSRILVVPFSRRRKALDEKAFAFSHSTSKFSFS